jgi:hypothetical protein
MRWRFAAYLARAMRVRVQTQSAMEGEMTTITVYVVRGVVQSVNGVPEGVRVEVHDSDGFAVWTAESAGGELEHKEEAR